MKAIVFGVDGTIFNTQTAKAKIFSQYLNELWGIAPSDSLDYWWKTAGGPRREKFEFYYQKKFGSKLSDEEYEKLSKEFGDRLQDSYKYCDFISGVQTALVFVRKNFDKVFAVTGTPQLEMEEAFKNRDISKYFDQVYGTSKEFPDKTAQLADIASKYNLESIILVSHSKEDIAAGLKVNCQCIGVTSIFSAEDLKNAGAKDTISDLSELPTYLSTRLQQI